MADTSSHNQLLSRMVMVMGKSSMATTRANSLESKHTVKVGMSRTRGTINEDNTMLATSKATVSRSSKCDNLSQAGMVSSLCEKSGSMTLGISRGRLEEGSRTATSSSHLSSSSRTGSMTLDISSDNKHRQDSNPVSSSRNTTHDKRKAGK